jgi:hypothetical protein
VDRRLLTKEQMAEQLRRVRDMGWLESRRPLNSGGIGNTIDHLLGLSENNLPIADTAEWELKTHRAGSSSLITLFHMEPRPRSVVPNLVTSSQNMVGPMQRVDQTSSVSARHSLLPEPLTVVFESHWMTRGSS